MGDETGVVVDEVSPTLGPQFGCMRATPKGKSASKLCQIMGLFYGRAPVGSDRP